MIILCCGGAAGQLICPTGWIGDLLSSPFCENFLLRRLVETALLIPPSRPERGAYRDRHGRWVRDAVDAAASAHESAQTNDADADGEVVWS
jgi:hypothetical protein